MYAAVRNGSIIISGGKRDGVREHDDTQKNGEAFMCWEILLELWHTYHEQINKHDMVWQLRYLGDVLYKTWPLFKVSVLEIFETQHMENTIYQELSHW